jgi:hypothetical protein
VTFPLGDPLALAAPVAHDPAVSRVGVEVGARLEGAALVVGEVAEAVGGTDPAGAFVISPSRESRQTTKMLTVCVATSRSRGK